jgi:2-polyprenyl-6-hydroxyphenyl methylase/3-demethylubiquinone-9 3-methyltransferase
VTGIDLGEKALGVAKLHLLESGLKVDYRHIAAEDIAKSEPASFDVVTCLEMLEHVPDPASIVRACTQMVKPGGQIFFSTINRNPKAYLFAVVGAEYVLRMLPRLRALPAPGRIGTPVPRSRLVDHGNRGHEL